MIPFEEMDKRLESLGKSRAWLAENTPYSPDYIRTVLAPGSTRRTERIQKVLSDAIEREEADDAMFGQIIPPGFRNVFMDDAQLDRADRASRAVGAPSLAEFCRDAILFRANEILSGSADPVSLPRKTGTDGL